MTKSEQQAGAEAGVIASEWLDSARSNQSGDETVEAWICRALNAASASIDAARSVWVEGAGGGRWLTQDEIGALCTRIDAGV